MSFDVHSRRMVPTWWMDSGLCLYRFFGLIAAAAGRTAHEEQGSPPEPAVMHPTRKQWLLSQKYDHRAPSFPRNNRPLPFSHIGVGVLRCFVPFLPFSISITGEITRKRKQGGERGPVQASLVVCQDSLMDVEIVREHKRGDLFSLCRRHCCTEPQHPVPNQLKLSSRYTTVLL